MKIPIYDKLVKDLGYNNIIDCVLKNKNLLNEEKQKLVDAFLKK